MRFLSFLITALFALAVRPHTAQEIYVNKEATGANNGSSWENAYTELSTALNNYPPGATVLIAKGTYYITTTNDPTAQINLSDAISIYGGFAGFETSLNQRNWQEHPTIISGDIGVEGVDEDNSNRFFRVSSEDATFDGLIFEKLYQGDQSSGFSGNTIRVLEGAKVTVKNCIFRNITAWQCAGIQTVSILNIDNCLFHNNYHFSGGSIVTLSTSGSSCSMVNCTFADNSWGTTFGSAVGGSNNSGLFVYNSIFSNTWAGASVSGASNWSNCLFNGVNVPSATDNGTHVFGDPHFEDPENNDYRLSDTSIAINAGNNAYVSSDMQFDLASNPRVVFGTVDLGSYESPYDTPTCLGDFDNNGNIDAADLLFFLSDFGCTGVCGADLNESNNVGAADLLIFLSLFGNSCS
jgi:hypothetical protein